MNVSRRTIAVAMAGTLLYPALETCCKADDDATVAPDAFAGIWSSHYRQTFIYLIIQPNHTAVFALLDQAYSFVEVPWFPADNGIIVGGFPMLRLWKTNQTDRCKVQMQAVPPEATKDTFVQFPLNFFMRRQERKPLPTALAELKVPKVWLGAEPLADFNDTVGKPREVTPN
jgi:hypothetical protein